MGAVTQAGRTVREGGVVARADFGVFYTWRTWLGGWLVRIICQVLFYSMLATMVADTEYVIYVLLGAALMVSVAEAMMTCASTTWDMSLGTLPLLASAPARPGLFFLGRSVHWPTSGVATTMIVLVAVPPIFGVTWSVTQLPVLLLLVIVSTYATYFMALLCGVAALHFPGARNVISTIVTLTTTAFSGALVPVTYWPAPITWLAQALPVTHGLAAVRALQAGAPAGEVAVPAALAAAVGLCWLMAAMVAFEWVFRRARRGGVLLV